jgi:hypothetical protein
MLACRRLRSVGIAVIGAVSQLFLVGQLELARASIVLRLQGKWCLTVFSGCAARKACFANILETLELMREVNCFFALNMNMITMTKWMA